MAKIKIRKGMPSVTLGKAEFARRMRQRFYDPAFESLQPEVARLIGAAWEAYDAGRKAPRTRPAGPGHADPAYQMSVEWLATRDAIARAERRQKAKASKSRVLLINGSPRNEHTCPGEISKTFRLISTQAVAAVAGAVPIKVPYV